MSKTTKITNAQLWDAIQPLQTLINASLPRRVSYTCSWNAQKVQQETRVIADERAKIIQAHAEKDEKGQPVVAQEDGSVKFASIEAKRKAMEEINELMAIEHDAFEYRPVIIEDIPESTVIPGVVFLQLDWMFEEAGDNASPEPAC